jgi:hypothetical protein
MSEVLDVINAFGTPLKVAWVVWLAWGVGQFFWLRYERSGAPARKPAAAVKPVARKPITFVKGQAVDEKAQTPAEVPVAGRLITPQHVAAEPKPAPRVEPKAEPSVEPQAPLSSPVFDPSQAVIEQFGNVGESPLDKFVADFERQDAHPRRRMNNHPAPVPSYGAEAPPTA